MDTGALREELGPYGPRLIEQLPAEAVSPGPGAPFEIEYTVDPRVDAQTTGKVELEERSAARWLGGEGR